MTFSLSETGALRHHSRVFGKSRLGVDLKVIEPLSAPPQTLVLGSIHGDESLTTLLLSQCLRSLEPSDLKATVILAVNPDGVLVGTRGNARGVDLNRNFPCANWTSENVYYRNHPEKPQDIALSPGTRPGSEPETQALIELVRFLKPKLIVSLHGFLGCIDDPLASDIARDLAARTGMEQVRDVGYSTPGSFGSWCAEQQISIITYEIPAMELLQLRMTHLPVLQDLLTGTYDQG